MDKDINNYIRPLKKKPKYQSNGEVIFYIDKKLVNNDDEMALGLQLISNRPLFGQIYFHLIGKYFNEMKPNSGVLIQPFVQSKDILYDLNFPGDIDLLIIPYEGDNLIISKTLVIELKILRAKFSKQNKSPNEFGFSQAQALLNAGFPQAAIVHLIVSDTSPENCWREMQTAKVVNSDSGEIELFGEEKKDMMPADLIERSYGRLKAHCSNSTLGFLSCYMEKQNRNAIWFPMGKEAKFNPITSFSTLDGIYEYYHENYEYFLDTKRY